MSHCKLLWVVLGAALCLSFTDAQRRRPKIIGGEERDAADFKYHVAILNLDPETGDTHHVCGGAIIHRRYVLTAAHCVYDKRSSEVLVRAGGNTSPPDGKPHRERRVFRQVAKIMYPRDYIKDARYHEFDVAVLKIVGTFDLADDKMFKKLQLPVQDNDYEGKEAAVSGFGVHNAEELTTPVQGSNFKTLKTEVISNDECQDSRTYILTRGSLCTKSLPNKGHTCYGDGGDPLVYDDQIIGILNAPSTCNTELPELFTRVSTYVNFIQKILDGRVSSDVIYR